MNTVWFRITRLMELPVLSLGKNIFDGHGPQDTMQFSTGRNSNHWQRVIDVVPSIQKLSEMSDSLYGAAEFDALLNEKNVFDGVFKCFRRIWGDTEALTRSD